MSWQALTWACEQKVKATDKLVLIMLANRVNHDTGRCTPAIERLAEECGLSRSGAKLALTRLQEAGLLKVIFRSSEGVSLSNQYELSLHKKLATRPPGDRPPGHDVTTNQESKPKKIVSTREPLDFSDWPAKPSDGVLAEWIVHRRKRKAPTSPAAMRIMGRELKGSGATTTADVDEILATCINRGWTGFEAGWLAKEKGPTVRPGPGNTTTRRSDDYAQGGRSGNRSGTSAVERTFDAIRSRRAGEAAAE